MTDKGHKGAGLIGPAERAPRWRALVRLEGRGQPGQPFIEPGEVFELAGDAARIYVEAGLIEAVDDGAPLAGRSE